MRNRSYNQEIKYAVAQFMDCFNEISISRSNNDDTKLVKVLSVYGDRQKFFKQLENTGKSITLPMLGISISRINRDNERVCDVNNFLKTIPDVTTISDARYLDLFNRFNPVPINIEFKMNILAKYHEDFDQIVSNFIAIFNPSIYVVTTHPKISDAKMNNKIVWNGEISNDFMNDKDIKEVCEYACETSFTYQTWIFPGTEQIGSLTSGIIERINVYPELVLNSSISGTWSLANWHAVPTYEDFDDYEERILTGGVVYPYHYDWLPMFAYPLSEASGYFSSSGSFDTYLAENPGVSAAFLGYWHSSSGLISGLGGIMTVSSILTGDMVGTSSFVYSLVSAGYGLTAGQILNDDQEGSNLIVFDGYIASPSVKASNLLSILSSTEYLLCTNPYDLTGGNLYTQSTNSEYFN